MLYSIVVLRYRKLFITHTDIKLFHFFYNFEVPCSTRIKCILFSFSQMQKTFRPPPLSREAVIENPVQLTAYGHRTPTRRSKRMGFSPLVLLYISCRRFQPVVLHALPHRARESHRHPKGLNIRVFARTRPNCPSALKLPRKGAKKPNLCAVSRS